MSTNTDTRLDVDESQRGYPALAWFMGRYPEHAIFRRFTELNIMSLLRLQAELQDLEHQLTQARQNDFDSGDDGRRKNAKDFWHMRDQWESHPECEEPSQHSILVTIETKLKEYNNALALLTKLKETSQPSERDLGNLKRWLEHDRGGDNFLVGEEAFVWEERPCSEFVSLFPSRLDDDAFTSFLTGRFLDIYHGLWGHRSLDKADKELYGAGVREYSKSRIGKASSILGVTLSSLLPTLAILVLYFVERMLVRIGLVIVFTAMFSSALSVFTTARKIEVFSATAAFAAVEVVFIGSTVSSG